MRLRPEGVKVLVLPKKVEEKTEGGIWRPEVVKEAEQVAATEGTIVAIGPAAALEFYDGPAKVGDRIMYAKYGGAQVKFEDANYRIINDEDVLLRIDDADKDQESRE